MLVPGSYSPKAMGGPYPSAFPRRWHRARRSYRPQPKDRAGLWQRNKLFSDPIRHNSVGAGGECSALPQPCFGSINAAPRGHLSPHPWVCFPAPLDQPCHPPRTSPIPAPCQSSIPPRVSPHPLLFKLCTGRMIITPKELGRRLGLTRN